MPTLNFRRESRRLVVVAYAFDEAIRKSVPHLKSEALAFLENKLCGSAAALEAFEHRHDSHNRPTNRRCLHELITKLREHATYIAGVLKRKPLTGNLQAQLDGDFAPQMGAMLKVARKMMALPEGPARFQVGATHLELKWGDNLRDGYKLMRELVVPGESEHKDHVGMIEIDEILMTKGGPFTLEMQDKALCLRSLRGLAQKWRVTLGMIRDNRWKRGSWNCKDLIHRMRNDAGFKIEKAVGRYSRGVKVTVGAGKVKPTWLPYLERRETRVLARADALQVFHDSLETAGAELAAEFLSSGETLAENARRELSAAQVDFSEAARSLYRMQQEVCYKNEIPSGPYAAMPDFFPRLKSVSDGLSRQHKHAKSRFESSWTRLSSALFAVRGEEVAA